MPPQHKSRFWRRCRIYFRRFRIAVWLTVLFLLGAMLYLNQVGLPGFIKGPLLARLHARGLDLSFTRLRLRWYQGIVAENVSFGDTADPLLPHLRAADLQLRVDVHELLRLRLRLDSVLMRRGRFLLTVGTNETQRELSVDNIQSELRFLPNDQWELDNFKAQFAGADIQLSGVVTNASLIRDWKVLHGAPSAVPSAISWPTRLRRLADTLERIHFSAPPVVHLQVAGDGRDPQSFSARMLLAAAGADTPWGSVTQGRFSGHVLPADTNGLSHGDLQIEADNAQTPWGAVTNLSLVVRLSSAPIRTNVIAGELRLSADRVQTPWARGTNLTVATSWVHSLASPVPLSGHGELNCEFAQASNTTARLVHFVGELGRSNAKDLDTATATTWDWWTNLQPYSLAWGCSLRELHSRDIELEELVAGGTWAAPLLTVTNITGQFSGASLTMQGSLDVSTRVALASLSSAIDPHRIALLLPTDARSWLAQFTWRRPPRLEAKASFVLPPWTDHHPDWVAALQPQLKLQGEVAFEAGGAFRSIPFTQAYCHFIYTNLCWCLPELMISRPEGGLKASHFANQVTKQFYWQLNTTLDPMILMPLLGPGENEAFKLFTFSQPPKIVAEIWGNSTGAAQVGFKGTMALTNFSFRGESFATLNAALQYTNQLLTVVKPQVQLSRGEARADLVLADFAAGLVYLTNGYSTAEPMVIARAIGPQIAKAIQDYQFSRPPVAHVEGIIPMTGEAGADLYFELEGGPFHWWKFNLPQVSARVHWAGDKLSLRVARADFYQGTAAGNAEFDFTAPEGADFQAAFATTNALLQELMSDLSPGTNHLEGRLSGNLVLTHANTEHWQSVMGYGELNLRDGLLWDIPLFGVFSPVLEGISPNLGHSRATAATCTYYITNGVIFSKDLEIRSTSMRLQYRGTVDLIGRLNAHVDAELLRNVWVVGPLVSSVLWPVTKMFEYKVGGSLDEPKMEPVFIVPKIVLMPFHPFRTLKGLFPEEPEPNPASPAAK